MAPEVDPYAVLGVSPVAPTTTIRKRYHALARAAHPDLVGDGGLLMMQRLNAAWDILRDPTRRARYDATRPGRGWTASAGAGAPGRTGSRPGSPAPGFEQGAGRPAWTGAAGPPPGRPSGTRLDFGLYAGWTLGEIGRYDPGYLQWLAERKEGRPLEPEIRALLVRLRPAAPERPERRRWRGR